MRFRRPPLALVLLAVIAPLGACVDTLSVARERTGFISAITRDAGGGTTYALAFVGAFYRYNGLTVGIGTTDSCVALTYSIEPPTVASLPTLDAGLRLTTLISGREDTLFQSNSFGLLTYELISVPAVPFTPGDTLTVTIPGTLDGFPAATVRTRTAEPFTYSPIGTVASGAVLPITWTAAPQPGSMLVFSMRFNASGTGAIPDTQIRCQFVDDGSGTVEAAYAAAWSVSLAESRSVKVQRIRYSTVEIDPRTKVTLLSFFDRPLVLVTP